MADEPASMAPSAFKPHTVSIPVREKGPPPFHRYPSRPMTLFDPDIHLTQPARPHSGPSSAAQPLPLNVAARANPNLVLIPRVEDCHALWDSYFMRDNIRAHSTLVASMACGIGREANKLGYAISPEALTAAGLLHDLGKTYTIAHGGSHAQLGAAWTMRETRNGPIAQAVLFHVHWPWPEELLEDEHFLLTAIILYADKRVKHDQFVGLDERFEDLLARYGVDDYSRERITASHQQGTRIETALSRRLEVDLHECTADSGWLVKRT